MTGGPPPAPVPSQYTTCIVHSSATFRVPPDIITSVLMVEGGKKGTKHRNANGTYDLGPMQINTSHRNKFRRLGLSEKKLQYNICANIAAGTLMIHKILLKHPNNPWNALGNYHSTTPRYHRRWLRHFRHAYTLLNTKYQAYTHYLRVHSLKVAQHNEASNGGWAKTRRRRT